jgi:hypothetical protein
MIMDDDQEKLEEMLSPDRDFVLYKKDGAIVGGGYQISADIKPMFTEIMGGGLADDLLHNLVVPSGLYMQKRTASHRNELAGGADIPTLTEDIYARLLKIAQSPTIAPASASAPAVLAPTKKQTRRRKPASTAAKKTKRRRK